MLFKVENIAAGRTTHCGVLEFVAQEGHVYLPRWVGRLQQSRTADCQPLRAAACIGSQSTRNQPTMER
jgi:ubiquitin fusion degradation protein 1